MIDTSYFAIMTLPEFSVKEFSNCVVVLKVYPMQSAKEEVAPRLGPLCTILPERAL